MRPQPLRYIRVKQPNKMFFVLNRAVNKYFIVMVNVMMNAVITFNFFCWKIQLFVFLYSIKPSLSYTDSNLLRQLSYENMS